MGYCGMGAPCDKDMHFFWTMHWQRELEKNIWLLKRYASEANSYNEGRSLDICSRVLEETGLPQLHAPFFSLVIRTRPHFHIFIETFMQESVQSEKPNLYLLLIIARKYVCNEHLVVRWCANLLKLYIYEN